MKVHNGRCVWNVPCFKDDEFLEGCIYYEENNVCGNCYCPEIKGCTGVTIEKLKKIEEKGCSHCITYSEVRKLKGLS